MDLLEKALIKINSFIRNLNAFNKYCKDLTKKTARISALRVRNEKTHFVIQLIGRNTCSTWLSAYDLMHHSLFLTLSLEDKELIKSIYLAEYKNVVNVNKTQFYISAIDFTPYCIMTISSLNNSFKMKLTPVEIFSHKKLFSHLNHLNQTYVVFYMAFNITDAQYNGINKNKNIIYLK